MAFRPTDIELIREVLHDSNARAFETLMKRYTSQVYGAALRLMKDCCKPSGEVPFSGGQYWQTDRSTFNPSLALRLPAR